MSPREKAVLQFRKAILMRLRHGWPFEHATHLMEYVNDGPEPDVAYPFWAEAVDLMLQKREMIGVRVGNLVLLIRQRIELN